MRNFFWILLLPFCCAWAIVTKLRRRYYPISWQYRAKFPVICVGNIHSGGSGKTPLVIEIADRFKERRVAILSRGYMGTLSRKGSCVEPLTLFGDKLFGDEPWMMAHRVQCPVFIGQDRVRITKQLEREGMTSLLILDDGFQRLSLARTVDIVAISTQKSLEEFCLPLGDLREPFSSLRKASAVVLTRGDENARVGIWKEFLREWIAELPVFESVRENMGLWYGNEPIVNMGRKMGGFCGIAEPAGFVREMNSLGASVCLKTFPDHHPYTEEDLEWILAERERLGADLMVTTDKDWFKVYPLFEKRGQKVYSLRIRSKLSGDFWSFLERQIA